MSLRPKNKISSDIEKYRSSRDFVASFNIVKKNSSKLDGTSIEAIVTVEYFLEKEDIQNAKNICKKALIKDPQNEELISLAGKIELELDEIDEAYKILSSLSITSFLDDKNSLIGVLNLPYARLLFEGCANKGYCLERKKKVKRALAVYTEVYAFYTRLEREGFIDEECKRILELALFRTAGLYMKVGNMEKSMEYFRICLAQDLSAPILHKVYTKFGRLLSRKCSLAEYIPLETQNTDRYLPKDNVEEALLLLLLFEEATPFTTKQKDLTIYDDLALLHCKRRAHNYLLEVLERLITHEYKNIHFWQQFAFSLINSKRYKSALFILERCIGLYPKEPVFLILAAKVSFNHFPQDDQIMKWCDSVILLARDYVPTAYHILGLCYSRKSFKDGLQEQQRKELWSKSLDCLEKAYNMDPNSYQIVYHLALQCAHTRQINRAIEYTQLSLSLNTSFPDCWNLLALLLSSQKQYADALNVCKAALQERKEISLLITKAKLEQVLGDDKEALATLKEAFIEWKEKSNNQPDEDDHILEIEYKSVKSVESSVRDSVSETGSHSDHKSIVYTHTMSVISDGKDEPLEQKQLVGPIQLWLEGAQLFCDLGQFKDATTCIQEARTLANLAPDVLFYEGLVQELQNKIEEGISFFEKALAIDGSHQGTLVHLGSIYHKQGKYLLAEKYLTTAVRNNLNDHEGWFHLGEVLKAKGEFEKASECFLTAVHLEDTAPILPFEQLKQYL